MHYDNNKIRQGNPEEIWSAVTLIYITSPVFLFLLSWVRWEISLPLLVSLLWLFKNSFNFSWINSAKTWRITPSNWLLLGFLMGFSAYLGIGGFCHQKNDWYKHNAILYDLTTHQWPVGYNGSESTERLVYYMAYYLPSALIGKIAGWYIGNLALWLWSIIGLYLIFIRFTRLTGLPLVLSAGLIVIFSGWDIPGEMILILLKNLFRSTIELNGFNQKWAGLIQYTSDINILFWRPQHVISGWLATLWLWNQTTRKSTIQPPVWLLFQVCLMFWSPFVFIGTLPFVFFLIRDEILHFRTRHLAHFFFTSALGLLFSFYFLSMLGKQNNAVQSETGFSITLEIFHTQAITGSRWAGGITGWLLFFLLEVGVFLPFMWKEALFAQQTRIKHLCLIFTSTLFLIPLLKVGLFNDFAMNASVPGLFVILIMTGKFLSKSQPWNAFKIAALAVILVGSLHPICSIFYQFIEWKEAGYIIHKTPAKDGLKDIARDFPHVYNQCIGNTNSLFFRYFAKR